VPDRGTGTIKAVHRRGRRGTQRRGKKRDLTQRKTETQREAEKGEEKILTQRKTETQRDTEKGKEKILTQRKTMRRREGLECRHRRA
jgi:hypothetical protein